MKLIGTLMLLLISAIPAAAECAWVLWSQQMFFTGGEVSVDPWLLLEPAPTHAACKDVLASTVKRVAEAHQAGVNIKSGSDVVTKTITDSQGLSATYWFRYQCLPDTVDPRGPKGK